MQHVLTEKFVAGLAYRGTDYIAWDAKVRGLGVRVWKGGAVFVVQLKIDGKSRRKTLGGTREITLDDARERAQSMRGAVRGGRDPIQEEQAQRAAWTLDDAMDYFAGDYAAARRLSQRYQVDSVALYAKTVKRPWGSRKLKSFSQDDISRRHTAMDATPVKANRLLALLSKLFELGIEKQHCDRNPTKGVRHYPETKRDRFLSDVEIRAVWEYLSTHDRVVSATAVMLVLLTGARPQEVYAAKWADVNLKEAIWTKPASTTKQRKTHIVHLSPAAVGVLARLNKLTAKMSPYLFPSPSDPSKPVQDGKTFWRSLRKALALPGVRLYDVRHTYASQLTLLGAGVFEVKDALGHASIVTTQRYVHLGDQRGKETAALFTTLLPPGELEPDQVPRRVVKRGRKVVAEISRPVPKWLLPK